jgi:hypothetical protein
VSLEARRLCGGRQPNLAAGRKMLDRVRKTQSYRGDFQSYAEAFKPSYRRILVMA